MSKQATRSADPPPAQGTDEASIHPGPLLLRAAEAAAQCGVALRTWRAWDSAGRIPHPMRIARSTRWRADELRAWVAAGCPDRETWQALQV